MTVTSLFKTQSNDLFNKNKQSALHISRNIKDILQCLANGVDANSYDKFKRTPLSYWRGTEIAQILIDNGACVDKLICVEKEYYRLTQMHICDDIEWAKFLINNGYQKDMRDGYERTALSKIKNPTVIQYLIDDGFDLYAKDKLGRTAFHNNDCYDALECLLKNNSNKPLSKDRNGLDPIINARTLDEIRLFSQHGGDLTADNASGNGLANKIIVGLGFYSDNDEIRSLNKDDFRTRLNELCDIGVDIYKADRIHGNKLHHWATIETIYPLMELLIDEYGFHPDDRNVNGDSCVHLAADDLKSLQILVKRKGDIHALNGKTQTPLFKAEKIECIDLILKMSADINHRDVKGKTVLFYCQQTSLMKAYIERNINLNIPNNDGNTFLHFCEEDSQIQMLLQAGASPHIQNEKGKTPMHCGNKSDQAIVLIGNTMIRSKKQEPPKLTVL